MRPLDYEKARLRYASLCARSEQCCYDIRMKAKRAGLSSEDTERVIDYLVSNRFIDERRFAGAFARDKATFSGWGPYKIKGALILKRIPWDIIDEAMDSIPEETYTATVKKIFAMEETPQKRYRKLASKGFNPNKYI